MTIRQKTLRELAGEVYGHSLGYLRYPHYKGKLSYEAQQLLRQQPYDWRHEPGTASELFPLVLSAYPVSRVLSAIRAVVLNTLSKPQVSNLPIYKQYGTKIGEVSGKAEETLAYLKNIGLSAKEITQYVRFISGRAKDIQVTIVRLRNGGVYFEAVVHGRNGTSFSRWVRVTDKNGDHLITGQATYTNNEFLRFKEKFPEITNIIEDEIEYLKRLFESGETL